MWFLPFDITKIQSNLSVNVIGDKLSDAIDKDGYTIIKSAPPPNHKPFRGSFDSNGFMVTPWIQYKNPFLPLIIGRIISGKPDNIIYVTMFPHPFGILLIWIFLFQVPFIWFDKQSLQLVTAFLIYVFTLLFYKAEAISSMDLFKKILK